jgi:hypothetical protein
MRVGLVGTYGGPHPFSTMVRPNALAHFSTAAGFQIRPHDGGSAGRLLRVLALAPLSSYKRDSARVGPEAAAFDCADNSTEASGKFAEFLTAIRLVQLRHQPCWLAGVSRGRMPALNGDRVEILDIGTNPTIKPM